MDRVVNIVGASFEQLLVFDFAYLSLPKVVSSILLLVALTP